MLARSVGLGVELLNLRSNFVVFLLAKGRGRKQYAQTERQKTQGAVGPQGEEDGLHGMRLYLIFMGYGTVAGPAGRHALIAETEFCNARVSLQGGPSQTNLKGTALSEEKKTGLRLGSPA